MNKIPAVQLRKAGLAYVVTEYRDVALAMAAMADTSPAYRGRAHRAQHTSHVLAYRWAVLNGLSLGGTAAIHAAQDHAAAYCATHRADVEAFVTMYDDHRRSPGDTVVG